MSAWRVGAVAALALTATLTSSAWATGSPPAGSAVGQRHGDQPGVDEHQRIERFWTPERMAAARIVPVTVPSPTLVDSPVGTVSPAPVTTVGPTTLPGRETALAKPPLGDPTMSLTYTVPAGVTPDVSSKTPQVCAPSQPACAPPVGNQQVVTGELWSGDPAVVRTVGKVYFTTSAGNEVCSAASVSSPGYSVVVTAAHCVLRDGEQAQNWAFVPGYATPSRPYGTWTAASFHLPSGWTSGENPDDDYAFVRVNPRDGQTLAQAVGSLPIGFATPRGQVTTAFGYPGKPPYFGGQVAWCQGVTVPDTFHSSSSEGLECNLTEGASGGPRLQYFNGLSGVVTSVNSFVYPDVDPHYVWGPHFGDEAYAVYLEAVG